MSLPKYSLARIRLIMIIIQTFIAICKRKLLNLLPFHKNFRVKIEVRIFQDKEAYFYPVSLYIGMDDLQRIVKIALFKSTNQIQDFIIE